jgi:hypothetical protein
MKKYLWMYISFFLLSCGPMKISQDTFLSRAKASHKVIAILPTIVQLHIKEAEIKKIPQEELDEASMKLSFMIQNELYIHTQKKKYTVNIQNIKYTNDKLFAGGLSFNKYKTMNEIELAKILEVDAVILTETDLSKVSHKDFTIFLGLNSLASFAIGASLTALGAATAKEEQSDVINLQVGIMDAVSGVSIWKVDYNNAQSVSYGLDDFYRKSLKNVAKIIPYKK